MSNIITASDLATYMNKTLVTGLAQQVVDAVNQWVETRTKRCWGETATADERYDFKRVIWLRHQDITAINSIMLGWPGQSQQTIASTAYYWNVFGRLTMFMPFVTAMSGGMNGNFNSTSLLLNDYMEINYTYGVANVPEDLFLATLGIAAGFYNFSTNGQQNVVAANVGSYRLEYINAVRGTSGPGNANPANNTNEANWEIVESYKTRRA